MLPKKFVGRFTEMESKAEPVYGEQKIAVKVDGVELLKEGEEVDKERILTEEDFKRIKYLQYKNAVKKVDRKKFRDSDDEHQSESEDDLDGYEQEDGEMELEEGELEQDEPLDSS